MPAAEADVRREFCTLFDSNYLTRAVAMYRSLERTCPSFRLTAFCFDDEAERLLTALELPHMETVSLAELEAFDRELLSVKGDRTQVEYCWTATPSLPLFMLDRHPELPEVTYVDADLLFFSDPEPVFTELGEDSVLIIPHRYAEPYRRFEERSGTYNVQFMTFRRDQNGMATLNWWHDRCIEWCYLRYEDGKIGDQGYLNEFPKLFDGVHVLQHKGGGLAPWNASRYEVRARNGEVVVDDDPLVFFHFHGMRLRRDGRHLLHPPEYLVPDGTRELIYGPYVEALDAAAGEVRAVEPGFDRGLEDPPGIGQRLRSMAARARARLQRT